MVRRDLRRAPLRVDRLALEFVCLPRGSAGRLLVARPFDDDLVPLLRDAAERAVDVHEVKGVVVVVHELMSREKIEGGPDAEDHRRAREEDEDDVVSERARVEGG